jgi:hypothetical protein
MRVQPIDQAGEAAGEGVELTLRHGSEERSGERLVVALELADKRYASRREGDGSPAAVEPRRVWNTYWSQAGATSGNQSQTRLSQQRLKQALQQPLAALGNGKEGVDGSSPSEGSRKRLLIGRFVCQRENACHVRAFAGTTWSSLAAPRNVAHSA